MSQAENLAHTARAKLAAALAALQASPDVPNALMAVADPIADAMGALHRVERSHGADLSTKDAALLGVRTALDLLQSLDVDHPALSVVMESVAASLAHVHKLSRMQPEAAAVPTLGPSATIPIIQRQPTPQPQAQQPRAMPAPAQPIPTVALQPQRIVPSAGPQVHPQPVHPQAVQGHAAHPAKTGPLPVVNTAPAQVNPVVAASRAAASRGAEPQSSKDGRPPAQARAASRPPSSRPPPKSGGTVRISPPQSQKGDAGNVTVELGAHSVSNFYKGLGGNDVLEHGGLFVATYKIAKMGTAVKLRVLLPGDYEFTATGAVQWIREPMSGGESSEPGFGVRLTQISPEGRQLIYRYTRNREPMFYDDL